MCIEIAFKICIKIALKICIEIAFKIYTKTAFKICIETAFKICIKIALKICIKIAFKMANWPGFNNPDTFCSTTQLGGVITFNLPSFVCNSYFEVVILSKFFIL